MGGIVVTRRHECQRTPLIISPKNTELLIASEQSSNQKKKNTQEKLKVKAEKVKANEKLLDSFRYVAKPVPVIESSSESVHGIGSPPLSRSHSIRSVITSGCPVIEGLEHTPFESLHHQDLLLSAMSSACSSGCASPLHQKVTFDIWETRALFREAIEAIKENAGIEFVDENVEGVDPYEISASDTNSNKNQDI